MYYVEIGENKYLVYIKRLLGKERVVFNKNGVIILLFLSTL